MLAEWQTVKTQIRLLLHKCPNNYVHYRKTEPAGPGVYTKPHNKHPIKVHYIQLRNIGEENLLGTD